MFTIWGISSQPNTYDPGSIRDQRRIQKISPTAPIPALMGHAEDSSSKTSEHQKPWTPAYPYEHQELDSGRLPAIVAKQIMTKPVETLGPTATIEAAQELFQERRFRHVPVLGQTGILVGLLSDRDVFRANASLKERVSRDGPGSTLVLIQDVMVPQVLTAHPETEIRAIARVMFEERIGAMPIVDQYGMLAGMITRSDILRTVMQEVPFELWI